MSGLAATAQVRLQSTPNGTIAHRPAPNGASHLRDAAPARTWPVSPWHLALGLIAAMALALRLRVGPLTVDDAYIIFRYARHIADGTGFVYNPGQPVLGTTTPLYTLLLAGAATIGLTDLPRIAWILDSLFDTMTVGLLFLAARRLAGPLPGLQAATLFALTPMSIAYAAAGMETSCFVCLLVAAFWCCLGRHPTTAMACLAAATLVRPEGTIAAGLVLAARALEARRVPWRPLGAYAAGLLPWLVFATWYFGSPLPQTMAAKSVVYRIDPWINAVALACHALLPGESIFLLATPPPGPAIFAAAALLAAPLLGFLAYQGARLLVRWRRRGPRWARLLQPIVAVWLLFPLVYALAYAVAGLRGVRMFHWYLIPLTPFYIILLTLGVTHVIVRWGSRQVQPTTPEPERRTVGMRMARLGWAAFGLSVLWWLPGLVSAQGIGYPAGFALERERAYRQVALDYQGAWGPGVVVATPEIGTIGYHVGARILDTVGLVTPVAARYYPLPPELLASDNAIAPQLIEDAQPDYVVSLDQFMRSSLLRDAWFNQHYELLEARDAPIWDSRQLLVFKRQA